MCRAVLAVACIRVVPTPRIGLAAVDPGMRPTVALELRTPPLLRYSSFSRVVIQ
jgi:hypothetical protein